MFNVRDFGAVCDGVTDDTAAFQATLDAAAQEPYRYEAHVDVTPRGDYHAWSPWDEERKHWACGCFGTSVDEALGALQRHIERTVRGPALPTRIVYTLTPPD